ncbi:MAG: imidazole glycerol phosphate synthase subunit HisH [Planctomycetaceae bacterium]|jgi:glutamine amidotransferase|nr:imidazole glycerol phosphate synthase subunit HisH [Planctomycetaceae bacterium]
MSLLSLKKNENRILNFTIMLAIIDYKAGNLTSVKLAMSTIGVEGVITSDPEVVRKADRVIFCGVGAAGAAMLTLKQSHLDDAIYDIVQRGIPLLGICLGMQILLDYSEENDTQTLGIIPGQTVRFQPDNHYTKIPQIGWNSADWTNIDPNDPDKKYFDNIKSGSEFYFVHSYYPVPKNSENILATTEYANVNFASVIRYKNVIATQFHPEKSGHVGLKFLENFCSG